jgi:hypothetical protein
MKIHSFAYKNLETTWELRETAFDALNLLVGVSGVGKTQIIEALRTVVRVGVSEYNATPHARWSWAFSADGADYLWTAETAAGNNGHRGRHVFVHERVTRGAETLFERSDERFTFDGRPLPKLDPATSAVHLLSGEAPIVAVRAALEQVTFSLFSGNHRDPSRPFEFPADDTELLDRLLKTFALDSAPGLHAFQTELDPHREAAGENVFVLQLYVMQERLPERFAELRERFCEVFTSVDDLRVAREPGRDRLTVEIHERVGRWVPQPQISSGMLKTLVYLCEIETAAPGAVIVIDEFEASLGLNCLPAMTDALLARSDCQFIVTSHHPYVINKLPIDCWKLVVRDGSLVRLVPSRDIPELQRASHHEAFLRLINLDQYVRGIG